jgi:tetratricopeptide (TPR) repeat protein
MKHILTAFFLLFSAGAWAQKEEDLSRRAQEHMDSGNYLSAIELYDSLIRENKESYIYYLNRGWSKLNAGSFRQGGDDFLASLNLYPGCSRCYIGLSIISLGNRQLAQALDLAEKAVALNDTASFNFYIKGQVLEASGNYEQAEVNYSKAIELNSFVADYYYTRGSYYSRVSIPDLALFDFTVAIDLDSSVADYYFQRSYCYYLLGKHRESLSDVRKALLISPDNGDYYLAMGAVQDAMGQKEASAISYSYAIKNSPENPLAYFNRANVYYELQELDKSCVDYRFAYNLLKTGPDAPDAMMVQEIEGMMSNHCDTSFPSFYYHRGLLAINTGSYEAGLKRYDEGLRKWPHHPLLNAYKGNAFLSLKRYKEAEKVYTKALSETEDLSDLRNSYALKNQNIDPEGFLRSLYAQVYYGRSVSRLALGRAEAALEDVNKAIFLGEVIEDYDIKSFQLMKASILATLKRHAEANELLNNLILQSPEYAQSYVMRARISLEKALLPAGKKSRLDYGTSSATGLYYLKIPARLRTEKTDRLTLQSALDDCKTAVSMVAGFSEAYFVMAQIKYVMGYKDFCADLLVAESLGISDAMELMNYPCEENK